MMADAGRTRDEQLAHLYVELGAPLLTYSPRLKPGLVLVGIGAAVAAGFAFFIPLVSLLGVLVMILGGAGLWPELRSTGYRICPAGVVVVGWRRIECCRWADVASLDFIRTQRRSHGWALAGDSDLSADIRRQDGAHFVLNWITQPVMAFLDANVYAVLLPRVQNELNSGRQVSFGEVVVGPEGLLVRGALTRWDEIEKVEFQHTIVVRKRIDRPLYLFNVHNLSAFMALVNARLSSGRFTVPGGEAG